MTKWTKVTLGVIGASAVATAAVAANGGARGAFFQQRLAHRVAALEDAVQATPQQRQVIDAARDSIIAKMQAQRAKMAGEGPAAWAQLLTQDTIDTQAVYTKVDERAAAMQAMAREIVPELVKVHDVLTPAQRQTLATELQKHHGHRREGPQQ